MEFGSIPQAQFGVFSNLASTTSRIDARCSQILELIQKAFTQDSLIGANACRLEIVERTDSQPAVATLTTPLGNGRFVQGWSQRGKVLCAELIFEREQRDQHDRRFWEPVWGLTVPRDEPAHSGTGQDALSIALGAWGDDDRAKAFSAAISILSAIANGPLISKG
jgi:hypothetical protein